jgi:alpha-amylase
MVFGFVGTSFAGVMMQGFYWDPPAGGTWYDTMKSKAYELSQAGFTAIWFPSPTKGMGGGYSMGYDVYDHYDLGEYNQKGTIETRFGSRAELEAAIQAYKNAGMQTIVDTVMNHMMGADEAEYNPYTGTETWTKFDYVHDKFEKNYEHFHPNVTHNTTSEPYYGGQFEPDICFYNDYNYMGNGLKEWSKWLKIDIGFDGYRLDFVKGMQPDYLKSWKNTWPMSSSFTVGEYWDGNRDTLNWWANEVGMHVFDFDLFYTLKDMANSNGAFDMRGLNDAGLIEINPGRAVTFVENHDTDEHDPVTTNKMMAYAYILTHEGYPTVFWKDYYNYGLKDAINNLVWIHENLAEGSTSNLYSDADLYIAQRNGGKGLVVGLNDSDSWRSQWVQTRYTNTTLKDYTGQANDAWADGNGWVELWIPPKGYTVWSTY